MKRFFTFLMAVWALLSISQTVKAADYYIMGTFDGGDRGTWTKLDGKNMDPVGNNQYSQTYQCTKAGVYHFVFTGDGLTWQMCPYQSSYELTKASPSYGVSYTYQEGKANNYFFVNMESGKAYTFTFDDSNKTVACKVSGSSTTPTENYAKFYLLGSMNDWKGTDYPFTTTDNVSYTCTLSGKSGLLYFKPKSSADGTWLAPGASNAYITTEYQSTTAGNGAWMLEASSDKTYTITLDCSNAATPKIKYSEQGSGSVTPPTPLTNPIANRKYSEGYYLVGNFFNFDGDTINYKDAVFKFEQQKNDVNDNHVYMTKIPATLTARAQVMSVDATGTPTAVYGPGEVLAINNSTLPVGADNITATTGIKDLISSIKIENGTNYWNMTTRRTKPGKKEVGQDGSYAYYITVDKATGKPSKWEIKYTDLTRVAFLLSTNASGSALTVENTRQKNTFESESDKPQANFNSGKYFGSLYMGKNHEYYGVSNDLANNESMSSSSYDGAEAIKNDIDRPTYNKLFLFGNGGLDITQSANTKGAANWGTFKCSAESGVYILEFNTGKGNSTYSPAHGGTGAEFWIRSDRKTINSLSMVGPAIPGTTTADGEWDWASTVADMDFDVSENCYKTTIVTTGDNTNQMFRFVGNHTQEINWFENGTNPEDKAAIYPYDKTNPVGHKASHSDPNEVSYTQNGLTENTDDNVNIIWNRPAGTWTVRFYIYTYSLDGNNPSFRYFYTISKNSELELRDFKDVVYKSEENVRKILNRGEYQYFRTWSDDTAWKRPKNVDVFVVSNVTPADETHNVAIELTKINNFDTSEDVIPAKTGVILALKEGDKVPGAVFHKRKSLITYNTLVIPLEEATNKELSYTKTNLLEECIKAKNIPTEEGENVNYLFGFYQANRGLGETQYESNQFVLGFWISNGNGKFYANSCYLPIPKAKAEKLNLGTNNNTFGNIPTNSQGVKLVPALLFDFANIDSDVTGIKDVVNNGKLSDGKYYTLSGQQVEHPTAGGIYIHNGKKYIVK